MTNLVAMTSNAATAARIPPSARRPRATIRRQQHTHFATPIFRSFWPRPTILRHDPGLAASPPVRYILKVERSGYSPTSLIVRCGRTSPSRSGGAPSTAVPPAQQDATRANRSSPARTRVPAARTPTESPYRAQTRSRRTPCGDDPGRLLSHPSSHQEQQVTLPHIKSNKPDAPTYSKIILLGVLSLGRLRRASQEDRDSRYSILRFAV